MLQADRIPRMATKGNASPRLAPPVPAKSLIREYEAAAKELGIKLMPWQKTAARYMTAVTGKTWTYRSVVIVVARQNGKTELLIPRIVLGLKLGRRMLHTAQNRSLPRETFMRVVQALTGDVDVTEIRLANGQEVIKYANGGRYTLVAPRPGVRGQSVDDVFLDEVREQRTFDLIAGIKPTITASRNPQFIYLSNAGDDTSIVLNDLRRRMDSDPNLAYLEWSAAPHRTLDDIEGWAEANPALGVTIQPETLADFHETLPPSVFETEHLCRWVVSMQPRLVNEAAWLGQRADLEDALRPYMAVNMDATGTRASAAIAWQQSDGSIGLRVQADVTGEPIDTDLLGNDLRQMALRLGVPKVGYGPWTDAELAKYFKDPKAIDGREFANASENFVRVIESGRLRWDDADQITDDLTWTARKPHETGAWMAVKAKEDRPITSVLAAIRAVWLASGPKPLPPKVM